MWDVVVVDHAPAVSDHQIAARVILADPPWRYRNWSDAAHGAASSAMDTMADADMAAIPVARWAHPEGAILAMWATFPKLPEAVRLMEAWRFVYVTGLPWVKTLPSRGEIRRGIGFWTQGTSELLLLGRRGEAARPDAGEPMMGLLVGDQRVFYAPRGRHSAKPLEVHDWLETASGPRLELFARQQRVGWTTWGLDLGFRLGHYGVQEEPMPAAGSLFGA